MALEHVEFERDDFRGRVLECYRDHTNVAVKLQQLEALCCPECKHPETCHVTGYGCGARVPAYTGDAYAPTEFGLCSCPRKQ